MLQRSLTQRARLGVWVYVCVQAYEYLYAAGKWELEMAACLSCIGVQAFLAKIHRTFSQIFFTNKKMLKIKSIK